MTEVLESPSPATFAAPDTAQNDSSAQRTGRLLSGLSSLSSRVERRGIDGERLLFLLGAVAVPLGMLFIAIGWYGASDSGLVFEQVPYVVSGGVGGLALVFLGCTLYGCWWITRAIREQRERHEVTTQKQDELTAAVRELSAELARLREGTDRR